MTEKHERPKADFRSIPSSVDPDADPLAPCSQCGRGSRRAYSKGLCVECVQSHLPELDCGFQNCENDAEFRLPDGKPCCDPCGGLIIEAMNA